MNGASTSSPPAASGRRCRRPATAARRTPICDAARDHARPHPPALHAPCREQAGREASPTAAIIDSQSVKGAEGGAASTRRALSPARRSRQERMSCLYPGLLTQRSSTPPISRTAMAGAADVFAVPPLPLPAEAVRRQWLPGPQVPGRAARRLRPGEPGDRQAIRLPQVRRAAEALDRREDHRLAQPMPTAGQGLGVSEPLRPRLPALGLRPPHAAKAMPENNIIPDGH